MASRVKRYHTVGTAAGTLRPSADADHTALHILRSDGRKLGLETEAVAERLQVPTDGFVWVHAVGLGNLDLIRRLGDVFGLHPLALEDALDEAARPKFENYDRHAFAIFQYPRFNDDALDLTQLALFFDGHFVVTLQQGGDDVTAALRERLAKADIAGKRADYIAYALIDHIVDSGFPVLETLGLHIEAIEDLILKKPNGSRNMERLHKLRRAVFQLRRMLWPQREVVSQLLREDQSAFGTETRLYLRDIYDHAVQILDVVESYRDMLASVMDVYLSSLSMRLNDVMRTLTVISTLFMPLTFIAGVYGMNFDRQASPWNMPELGWAFGYPFALGLMAAVTVAMLLFFRRKGWLGR